MARLSFLGAARTVTGSQYLLEAGGAASWSTAGCSRGKKPLRLRNWDDPCENPAGVDAVVLTHTHLDHIGRVPRLVKRGFRGPVYCTPPTVELAEVLLLDAAHLQEEDARYYNRKGLTKHQPALPLFDSDDAREALKLLRPVPKGETQDVGGPSLHIPRGRPPPRRRLGGRPGAGERPGVARPLQRRPGPLRRCPGQGP